MEFEKNHKEKVYKNVDGELVWVKTEYCNECKSEQEIYLEPSWLFHNVRCGKCHNILHSF